MIRYSTEEAKYIKEELKALESARQEIIPEKTLRQWVIDFSDLAYPAEQVCRMIKSVRLYGGNFKIKFSDFLNADISEVQSIMPPPKTLSTVNKEELTEREYREVMSSSYICGKVRSELDISYMSFLLLKEEKGHINPEEFFEFLKNNPEHITCERLSDKPKSKSEFTFLNEAIRKSL